MSWLSKLKGKLTKTSSKITQGLQSSFTKRKIDDNTLDELEDLLLMSDMGPHVAGHIIKEFAKEKFDKEATIDDIKVNFAHSIHNILAPCEKNLIDNISHQKPCIILVNGVNGTGKTTTIGKLAYQLKSQNFKPLMVACDTFRAAAVEQLEIWSKKGGCGFFKGKENADPASVAFDAYAYAENNGHDIVLIDTAGRLQNRKDLMESLAKITRVLQKKEPSAPHISLLVLDATTGQNILQQIQTFQEIVDINGLIMTKLDGSAKGGVLVAAAQKFKLPIYAIGVGEKIEDLKPFQAKEFAYAIMDVTSD